MKFPDLAEIVALGASDYEREFLRLEYAPGLDYYIQRIDRLMFGADRVLDAGCGAGQWTFALAQRFRHVDAIDLKPDRLAVLNRLAEQMDVTNVRACPGSLEQLPYSDATMDAVFCYGVLMFTRVEQVLAEFHRVLRPGGRVYVCLNADGWSRRLAERVSAEQRETCGRCCGSVGDQPQQESPLPLTREGREVRGCCQTTPQISNPGLTTLYTTYWQRAIRQGLGDALVEGAKDYPEGLLPWEERLLFKIHRRITRMARRTMTAFAGIQWKRSVARDALCRSKVGRELLRRVRGFCGSDFVPLLLDDVSAFLASASIPCRFGPTRAIRPDELDSIAAQAGFVDFQWSVEAGLACDWTKTAEPKYPGYHGDDLCVWECLLTKPERKCAAVSLQRHFDAARQAAGTPAYGEPSMEPVLSNASLSTYPASRVAYVRWQGELLGGPAYLGQLAMAVVGDATDEEQAVRRIIHFVQKAVFRDPVTQPLLDDGAIPDALTSLLCARGRCGHSARILVELFQRAGFDACLHQFPQHVAAEVRCGDRWVIADADAFKGGIVPDGPDGRLLSMEEIEANPYVLDRFPPTGWMIRPGSKHTCGILGHRVRGYVDALEPEQRGFVSGYYVAAARGFPPSLPEIRRFEACGGRFVLSWEPARLREGRLIGYRVRVGSRSRAWSYDDVFLAKAPLAQTPCDVFETETTASCLEGPLELNAGALFASVTAISDRVATEPQTFFWPSEEVALEAGRSR